MPRFLVSKFTPIYSPIHTNKFMTIRGMIADAKIEERRAKSVFADSRGERFDSAPLPNLNTPY